MKYRVMEQNGSFYPQFKRPGFFGWLLGWDHCKERSKYISQLLDVRRSSLAEAQEFIRLNGRGDINSAIEYHEYK